MLGQSLIEKLDEEYEKLIREFEQARSKADLSKKSNELSKMSIKTETGDRKARRTVL